MELKPPKGTRDIYGEEALKMKITIDKISQIFQSYGFEPLYTPAFEHFEILSAKGGLGEAVKDEIYFFEDKSGRALGLRFDLTMPLARFISSNPQIPKPFKRYVIAPVWRYDNPQRLRYREFWQADVDIVGSKSILSDLEVLNVAIDVLESLEIDFEIRVNDRTLLEKLFSEYNEEQRKEIFRTIDKLDKIGKDGVLKELEEKGFDKSVLERIENVDERTEKLDELFSIAEDIGIVDKLEFDPFLVRGLDYYTSLVFEINAGVGVSVGGGGRYDNLTKIFGRDLPATGISIGLSRILPLINKDFNIRRVFIPIISRNLLPKYYYIARQLRKKGVIVEVDVSERDLRKQLNYANSKGFDFTVFYGEEEDKKGVVKIRDMKSGEEIEGKIDETIKRILNDEDI